MNKSRRAILHLSIMSGMLGLTLMLCSCQPPKPGEPPVAPKPAVSPAVTKMPAPTPAASQIVYQLPTDGPLPKTYRVTLAATDPKNTDWIVSTFVAGGVRTVTAENGGKFTDRWSGLDDNGMPLPPGEYGVKGIYLPASKWEIDGQYHAIIPRYRVAAGDSWSPTPENDRVGSAVYNHCFGYISDIQVGLNGVAGFLSSYIENAANPFLVDLKKPIGRDQVIDSYSSAGFDGGSVVACDGEIIWCAEQEPAKQEARLFRADHKQFGETAAVNNATFKKLPVTPISMVAWRDAAGKRFLYAALPAPVNKLLVIDGEKGATLGKLDLNSSPLAVLLDQTVTGKRLILMQAGANPGSAKLASIDLVNGMPSGPWAAICDISGISAPTDCEMDSQGRFYVSDAVNNHVYQLDGKGKVLRKFGKEARQTPGQYDPSIFMAPRSLATWKTPAGEDRLLIVERSGPGRVSEWNPEGNMLREWFLCQNANNGYVVDPEHPEHLYINSNNPENGSGPVRFDRKGSENGSGLVRFAVDVTKGTWKVDAVWPDICRTDGSFPGGIQYPAIINANGHKYLCYAGGANWNRTYLIYREQGGDWIPSAGIVFIENGAVVNNMRAPAFWWHDANGDGKVQPEEYQGTPANLPTMNYWPDYWGSDLSLLVCMADRKSDVWRLAPSSVDAHGNPVFDGTKWEKILTDPILAARRAGKPDPLRGGNELADCFGAWPRVDGNLKDGYYLADCAGPANPGGLDNAGARYAQFKLSHYAPDGKGGFAMRLRVGRKAFRLAEPGEVYATQHITPPVYGILGAFDSNGLYYLYTQDGLYVDTVMSDTFRYGVKPGGMYAFTGEAWFGKHFLNKQDNQVYLAMGKTSANLYCMEGWTPDAVKPIPFAATKVALTAGETATPHPIALALRGGAGKAYLANFTPATGGGPKLDGSLSGWESAEPVVFGLDEQRNVDVRCMYDPSNVFLRWHVRTGNVFAPVDLGDPTTLFAHDRGASFVSFYLQGNPDAAPGTEEGRPGDMRVIFAIVKDGATVRPIAVGMYPKWTLGGKPSPAKWTSPVSSVSFEHVGLIHEAKLGYTLDADGKGFVIASATPKSAIPTAELSGKLRTQVDFAATLGGNVNFWWANIGGLKNATMTMDMPAEARLYPGAWAQAQFVGMEKFPVRSWIVCGPWGGEDLKNRPNDPHPQTKGHAFALKFFRNAAYPLDDRKVDMKAVYKSPLTQDVKGVQRELRWTPVVATVTDFVMACGGTEFGYAATWVYLPEACKLECDVIAISGGGVARMWVNDVELQHAATNYADRSAPVPKQTIAFRKGWNQVFIRGFGLSGGLKCGLVLHGPKELLWSVKVSATPQE